MLFPVCDTLAPEIVLLPSPLSHFCAALAKVLRAGVESTDFQPTTDKLRAKTFQFLASCEDFGVLQERVTLRKLQKSFLGIAMVRS
jgi:hypothetical protein